MVAARMYLALGACILALTLIGGVYLKGRSDGIRSLKTQIDAERTRALEAALEFNAKEADLRDALSEAQNKKITRLRVVTKEIIKEVPVHVTPVADAKCVVPTGFVLIHNAAVDGLSPPPAPADGTSDAPSGVALSEVAETVADNYGTCHELRQQVIGWQGWYAREKVLWESRK